MTVKTCKLFSSLFFHCKNSTRRVEPDSGSEGARVERGQAEEQFELITNIELPEDIDKVLNDMTMEYN